jgi:adenylate cyclase
MRSELGADFIVEGSVRRLGENVRVTVQLIDTETGNHVWSERNDRAAEDAFALQDQVTQAIAGTLPQQLDEALEQIAERKPIDELSAYEHLLIGERLSGDAINAENDGPALKHLEKAIEIDPTFGRAYAFMGHIYAYRYVTMGSAGREHADTALSHIERALRWSDDEATIHAYAAGAYLFCGEHELAEKHIEKAVALNPNDTNVMFWRAVVMTYLGDPEMSLALYRRVETLVPLVSEGFLIGVFDALYMLKRYSEAIAVAKRIRSWDASFCAVVAACCAQAGDVKQARSAVEKFESMRRQEFDIVAFTRIHVAMCRYPEDREHWLEGYRKAGFRV